MAGPRANPVQDILAPPAAVLRAQHAVAASIPPKQVLQAIVEGAASVSAATIIRTGEASMVTKQVIPLTRFGDYVATAKEIHRKVSTTAPACADLRPVVADLAALAVKALAEVQQSIEGLACLVMALHPEVTRTRQPRKT